MAVCTAALGGMEGGREGGREGGSANVARALGAICKGGRTARSARINNHLAGRARIIY